MRGLVNHEKVKISKLLKLFIVFSMKALYVISFFSLSFRNFRCIFLKIHFRDYRL